MLQILMHVILTKHFTLFASTPHALIQLLQSENFIAQFVSLSVHYSVCRVTGKAFDIRILDSELLETKVTPEQHVGQKKIIILNS